MARRKKNGVCTFCRVAGSVTDDHVPPKALFLPKDRPILPKVDACEACNNGASKDDEYFKMMLVMRDDVVDIPAAQRALEEVVRSLGRPDKARLKAATARNVRSAEKWQSGLFLGSRPAYRVDLERMARVVRRTVAGLFQREYGRPIPSDFTVHTIPLDAINRADLRALLGLFTIASAAATGTTREFGDGVFAYSVAVASDLRDATVWTLRFYGKVGFVAITVPSAKLEEMEERTRLRLRFTA